MWGAPMAFSVTLSRLFGFVVVYFFVSYSSFMLLFCLLFLLFFHLLPSMAMSTVSPQHMPVYPCRFCPDCSIRNLRVFFFFKIRQRERKFWYLKAAYINLHRYWYNASCCNFNVMWSFIWDCISFNTIMYFLFFFTYGYKYFWTNLNLKKKLW